ncbi:MAG: STAS domain-containing protein [Flavobacteriales bacterium]|jgi:anti-anti-sigma factor|nr:STAS domain-containing protein [Flavobacteriales bacterium]
MNFTIEDKGRYTLVTGQVEKLDTTCAPELKSELVYLNKTGVRNVIIDLSATRYCDSSGLSALLVANRLCKGVNGSLVVCGLQEPVQKLVQISQLESVLSITPSVSEAVDLLYMEEIEKDVDKDIR